MPAILSTIISAFSVFISFFRKIFPWLNGLTSYIGGFLAYKSFRVGVLTLVATGVVSGLLSCLYLAYSLIFQLFTLIRDFFSYFGGSSSGGVSQIVSCFYYFLDMFGITTVLNLAFTTFGTLLLAVITFWICKAAFTASLHLYNILAKAL